MEIRPVTLQATSKWNQKVLQIDLLLARAFYLLIGIASAASAIVMAAHFYISDLPLGTWLIVALLGGVGYVTLLVVIKWGVKVELQESPQ